MERTERSLSACTRTGIFQEFGSLSNVPNLFYQLTRDSFGGSRCALMVLMLSQGLSGEELIEVNSAETSIASGTVLPNGSTVVVSDGGTIGLGVDLRDGNLKIEGGEVALGANNIDLGFTNLSNEVLVTGGEVGGFFQLASGSNLTLAGGTIESFGVFAGSTADIFSGQVTRFPDIWGGAVVRVFGGDFFSVRVFQDGEVHFFGNQFSIDGEEIEGLVPNEALEITARNVTLSAILSDGSPLSFDLNTVAGGFFSNNPDGASSTSVVTVTLVSELSPSSVSLDSEVEFTLPQAGTICVPSQLNRSYRLRRTQDLSQLGAIIDVQEGTGEELVFSFDDSSSGSEQAFFFIEEV